MQHDQEREALRELQQQEDIARYVRGYRENPQTEDELGWSDEAARQHLTKLPWE